MTEQQGPTPGPDERAHVPAWDLAFEDAGGLKLDFKRTDGDRVYQLVRVWFQVGYRMGAGAADAHVALLAAAQGLMALVEIADSGQSVLPYDEELDIWDAAIGRLEDAIAGALGEAGPR